MCLVLRMAGEIALTLRGQFEGLPRKAVGMYNFYDFTPR